MSGPLRSSLATATAFTPASSWVHPALSDPSLAQTVPALSSTAMSGPWRASLATAKDWMSGPCSMIQPASSQPSLAHTLPGGFRNASSGPLAGSLATPMAVAPGANTLAGESCSPADGVAAAWDSAPALNTNPNVSENANTRATTRRHDVLVRRSARSTVPPYSRSPPKDTTLRGGTPRREAGRGGTPAPGGAKPHEPGLVEPGVDTGPWRRDTVRHVRRSPPCDGARQTAWPVRFHVPPRRDALGPYVRRLRQAAGLRPLGLAMAAGLHVGTIWAIEGGVRRAPVSTLRRIAEALTAWSPGLGPAELLTAELVGLAGPRLAPERTRSPRVVRRRALRRERRGRVHRWLDMRGEWGWRASR